MPCGKMNDDEKGRLRNSFGRPATMCFRGSIPPADVPIMMMSRLLRLPPDRIVVENAQISLILMRAYEHFAYMPRSATTVTSSLREAPLNVDTSSITFCTSASRGSAAFSRRTCSRRSSPNSSPCSMPASVTPSE